jgi:large subunit ribosomal protein L3
MTSCIPQVGTFSSANFLVKQGRLVTVSVGIFGTKVGMTQVFDDEGRAIPVTVVQADPCTVTQIKTAETDGYTAIQIGYGLVSEKALTKPELGHLKKSSSDPLRHLREYRLDGADSYELGQKLGVDLFESGQLVDVSGISIGRGFAGYQKRHNFRRGPMAHGSKNHRLPGSTGAGTTPGRVYPGKHMAGRMGGERVTIRKLTIVQVDAERNLLLIKGAVPGKPGSLLNIQPATIVGQTVGK